MTSASSARTAGMRHARSIGLAPAISRARAFQFGARPFGVEIEFKDITRERACAVVEEVLGVSHIHLLDYHGTVCQDCQQRVRGFGQWKVERDGSVSSGDWGGEIVSPILSGEDGLSQMRAIMQGLRQAGATVDSDCGLHVHLSVQSMSNEARAQMVAQFYEHHDTIDRFVAKSRTKAGNGQPYRNYCQRGDSYEISNQVEMMRDRGTFGYTDKYRSLNLTPYAKYGTVEVRTHQGSLNGRKVSEWIRLLVGFLDICEVEKQDQFSSGLALLGSMSDLGVIKQSTAAYLTQRAEQLA
jgi:hypothetical protein